MGNKKQTIKRKNILFADSYWDYDSLIRSLSRSCKYDFVNVGNLSEATERLEQGGLDGVLICDCIASGEDPVKLSDEEPYKCSVELTRRAKNKEVPVLFMNCCPGVEIQEALKNAGVDRIVEAPARTDEYIAAAQRVFG